MARPFDPATDDLWRDMIADRISERDYWRAAQPRPAVSSARTGTCSP